MCLQEILAVDIQQQIYRSLRQVYPYIYSALDLTAEFDAQTPACTLSDVEQLDSCVETQCHKSLLFRCIPERYYSVNRLKASFLEYSVLLDVVPC